MFNNTLQKTPMLTVCIKFCINSNNTFVPLTRRCLSFRFPTNSVKAEACIAADEGRPTTVPLQIPASNPFG
jgi:hypothetical protein